MPAAPGASSWWWAARRSSPGLDEALRRIDEEVFPYEDAMVRERLNMGAFIGKLLVIRREWVDGRMTVILVRQPVGV